MRTVAKVVFAAIRFLQPTLCRHTLHAIGKPLYQGISLVMEVAHLWYYPVKLKSYIIEVFKVALSNIYVCSHGLQ